VCTVGTRLVCKSGEKLHSAAAPIWFPCLGSNFLLVMVGIANQSWLSLCISLGWLLVCLWNHSLSRLSFSRVASTYGWVTILLYCLWLNRNIHYFLIGYGPTLLSDCLTARRLIGRIFSVTIAVAASFCCSNETPTLLLRHLK
jgi:hypothetical protein